MTLFSYGFSLAMCAALAIVIGRSWAQQHPETAWTRKMTATIAVVVIVCGVMAGWCLEQYFDFVFLSDTHRGY